MLRRPNTTAVRTLEDLSYDIDILSKDLTDYYKAPPASRASMLASAYGSELARTLTLQEQGWELYAGALTTAITGGNAWKNLQIVTVPNEIHWDDPDFGPYYFHKNAADMVNEVGGTYRKKSDSSFGDAYRAFVTGLSATVVNEDALHKSEAAQADAIAAQDRHATLEENIMIEWQAFDDRQTSSLPPARWISMEDWYQRHGKNAALASSLRIVLAYWQRYDKFIEDAFGGGELATQVRHQISNASLLDVIAPRTDSTRPGGKVTIYPYQISVDYPRWLADAKAGNHQRVAFSIAHDTYSYDYSSTSIGAGIGIGFGFFGILAGGVRQTVQIDTTSTSFHLDFQADLQVFEITPGGWYNTTALRLFANGPFVPNSPIERNYQMGTLFGPRGLLSFRPARAIVAYKPVIKLRLSRSEYHYFKQVTQGAAVAFLGPFAIGVGSYYDVQTSVRWDDQNFELNLYNAPETPVLLAFDSDDLP